MAIVQYVCPKHDDVVLFEVEEPSKENDKVLKFMTLDDTKKCHLCDISYFKEQCNKKSKK